VIAFVVAFRMSFHGAQASLLRHCDGDHVRVIHPLDDLLEHDLWCGQLQLHAEKSVIIDVSLESSDVKEVVGIAVNKVPSIG